MRIWTMSDLHMEMSTWTLPEVAARVAADVLVLAGDVHAPLRRSLAWIAVQRDEGPLAGLEIVMVAGNHEFYGAEIVGERAAGAALARDLGIHYLDRSSVIIDGVRFLGCTLWTDYSLYKTPITAQDIAGRSLSDHRLIEKDARKFLPGDALAEHKLDRAWLERALAEPFDGATVVVTHHCVSQRSVHARWQGDPLTPAFSSNLDALVERSGAALWVHGHTHDSFDYRIGNTRVVCNPKGYGPRRAGGLSENKEFDARLVIDVGQTRV